MAERQFTILIADDNFDILDPVAEFLESMGYKCKKAMNGKEAWDLFGANPIDLVITDHDMPIMGGAELIRLIREQDQEKPIILMSARESKELVALGATKILRKPIDSIYNLAAIVSDLLSNRTIDRDTLDRGHAVIGRLGQGIGSDKSGATRQKH